jgi:hypothetical protein
MRLPLLTDPLPKTMYSDSAPTRTTDDGIRLVRPMKLRNSQPSRHGEYTTRRPTSRSFSTRERLKGCPQHMYPSGHLQKSANKPSRGNLRTTQSITSGQDQDKVSGQPRKVNIQLTAARAQSRLEEKILKIDSTPPPLHYFFLEDLCRRKGDHRLEGSLQ